MGNMLSRVVVMSIAVAIVTLAIVLHLSQPSTVGPLGILVVFILMYMSALGVVTFLLYGMSKIIGGVFASFAVKKPIRPLTLGRSYYFSSVIALAPVMLMGMQSVAEVGVYDVLLILLFVVIGCVYISKRTS